MRDSVLYVGAMFISIQSSSIFEEGEGQRCVCGSYVYSVYYPSLCLRRVREGV